MSESPGSSRMWPVLLTNKGKGIMLISTAAVAMPAALDATQLNAPLSFSVVMRISRVPLAYRMVRELLCTSFPSGDRQ